MHDLSHIHKIMDFTKNYQLNYIDEQTLVIEPILSHNKTDKTVNFSDTIHPQPPVYLLKYLTLPKNSCDISQIIDTLSHHQTLNQKYLLTLQEYEVLNNPKATSIQAIYQYSNRSLKQEIQNRVQNNAVFDEDQLWAILSTIIKGLNHLQQNGIVYGVLGTDKIFINETVKLLDPSATATDPLLITQGRLYSPQILNSLPEIDMFKSDVYVAGLVLMECGLLIDLSQQVQPDLSHYFSVFRQTYSQELYSLLEQMLIVQPSQRLSLSQIKQYLSEGLDDTCFSSTKNKRIIPLENDEQPEGNTVQEMQQFQEIQLYDVLCEGDEEKYISEYEKAKLNYLKNSKNEEISPVSTTRSSQIFKVHRYNQENDELSQNTQRKKTKQIKNKLVKNMRNMEVQSVPSVQELSYESQDNDLFTDPQLMKIIQHDLERISTTRNSTMNKQNKWFCK